MLFVVLLVLQERKGQVFKKVEQGVRQCGHLVFLGASVLFSAPSFVDEGEDPVFQSPLPSQKRMFRVVSQ